MDCFAWNDYQIRITRDEDVAGEPFGVEMLNIVYNLAMAQGVPVYSSRITGIRLQPGSGLGASFVKSDEVDDLFFLTGPGNLSGGTGDGFEPR